MKEKFVRYGRLKPVKQKGFQSTSYHSPPKGKGFYAFPFGFEEIFLVAGLPSQHKLSRALPKVTKWEKFVWPARGEVEAEVEYTSWETEDIWRQKRTFEVDDQKLIWHHLEEHVQKGKVIKVSKSWCLTTIKDWKKAFNRCTNRDKMRTWREAGKGSVLEYRKNGWYSRDHLEVFFDYKV